MAKNHKTILILMTLLAALLLFNISLAEEKTNDEKGLEQSDDALTQPDKKAQDIIIRADRVRFPDKPFRCKVRLIEYRDHQKMKEQLLAVKMQIVQPSQNSPGNAKALISFLKPSELKNDKVLVLVDQVWYYSPKARRPVRISPQQRLMGQVSHGDVVASDFHYLYQSTLVKEEMAGEKDCYKLHLVRRWPFVTYPKGTYWVEKETYRPVKVEFYSSTNRLLKRVLFKDYQEALGDMRPREIVIEEGLIKNAYTRMLFSDAEFGDIPDVYFQPSYLEKMK